MKNGSGVGGGLGSGILAWCCELSIGRGYLDLREGLMGRGEGRLCRAPADGMRGWGARVCTKEIFSKIANFQIIN